jgi:hypothetical protein
MVKTTYKNEFVNCDVDFLMNGDIHLTGKVASPSTFQLMSIFAASPINRLTSYSGSGLPFPCAQVAFENSPNNYTIDPSGDYDVVFKYPNGYYMSDAKEKVPPSIFFSFAEPGKAPFLVHFKLPDPLPLRTLGYRPNRVSPLYYSAKEDLIPIAGAADTMMLYSYAKKHYDIA